MTPAKLVEFAEPTVSVLSPSRTGEPATRLRPWVVWLPWPSEQSKVARVRVGGGGGGVVEGGGGAGEVDAVRCRDAAGVRQAEGAAGADRGRAAIGVRRRRQQQGAVA